VSCMWRVSERLREKTKRFFSFFQYRFAAAFLLFPGGLPVIVLARASPHPLCASSAYVC